MVCIVSPRDRYTDIVPQRAIALCLLGRSPYRIATLHAPVCNQRPLRWWK
ncbi:hypothetical protein K4039_27120 [Lyngbya sp. CCAP 1446/10]|nr:hypothetical protein [Lyngbya sp. CCAP 1446/10]MCW6053622.1 hypothetical protein [Lyngbya sp. CCAP 1446/10]